MEIISYVQAKPVKTKINLPVFEKRTREKSTTIAYDMYTPQLHEFAIPKVRGIVTPKNCITKIGHVITVCGNFVKEKAKIAGISFIVLSVVAGMIFTAFYIYSQKQNFTGPLKIENGDSVDIENLNKMMASFAMDTALEIDESGRLLDSAQVSLLKYAQPVTYQNYKVRSGDTISGIAKKFGLTNISTIISVNDIGNVRTLAAGQKLKIPSIDGVIYTVKAGDTLDSIVKRYGINMNTLLDVNELSTSNLQKGQQLFLPGASMDSKELKKALGDKFIMPIQAKFRWSSPYGKRIDPIANVASFHTGTDMACPTGTPIVAAMSGRVITAGVSRVYGNYVIIEHDNGYQTLYAHMSKIIATKGQWVSQGTRIGLVGSTGYSTGPHLHFTVYKNGKMIDPMSVLK